MKKVRISLLCSLLCGIVAVFLSSCGVFAPVGSEHQHTEKAPVRENETPATCVAEGSYDEVVYCKVCDEELSRTTKSIEIDVVAHTASEPVTENATPSTCISTGYSDEVTYCKDCSAELKRTVVIAGVLTHSFDNGDTCTACGVEVDANGIEYKLNDDETAYTLISVGEFSGTELVIDSFNGLPITKIGERAFCKNETLTSISLPTSLTAVSSGAFLGCANLATVNFSGTETEWKSVIVESYNSELTSAAFTFVQPTPPEVTPEQETLVSNDGLTFRINDDKQGYTLTGVGSCLDTKISITTFKGLPVTKIASYAFAECDDITEIFIGKEVESIGDFAFEKCFSLSTITFEEGSKLKSIGESAFFLCDGLRTVALPDSVTTVSSLAFVMCHNLQTVVLGEALSSIGNNAFYGCFKLVEIINNSTLNLTKGSTDNGCVALYALEIHSGASKIDIVDGYRFYSYGGENHLLGYVGEATELILPRNYNGENYRIHDFAFYSKDNVTRVEFSAAITHIGEGAFMWCTALTTADMTMLSRVSEIGAEAFYGCASLEVVEIPDCVVSISFKAFDKCIELKELRLGTGVTSIGAYAFAECSKLDNIVYYGSSWNDVTIAEGNDCLLAAKAQALSLE